jgi:hypothetical protein
MITTMDKTINSTMEAGRIQVDPTWGDVYRVGGLSLVAAGILYLIGPTINFYFGSGTPGNNLAYLQALTAHPGISQIIYWIFTLADILFIPATLGLYLALKEINKNAMLIAAGLLGVFVVLDLGITESNTLALVTLTQSIATATTDAQQMAYTAAANWGLATLPLATFFSWIGPSIGFLITSIVMQKSIFGKSTAFLGIFVYSVAIVASFYFLVPVPALSITLTPILWLYGLWLIKAGRGLFKLGTLPVTG